MWEILTDFAKHYKSTAIKLAVSLFFIFLIVQYNSYGKRASAHALNLQIKNGMVDTLCVTSSHNVSVDKNGVFAMVKERKIYLPDQWGTTTKRDNLNLAIVMRDSRYNHKVFEIDSTNAKRLMGKDAYEGCKSFRHMKQKAIF